MTIRETKDLKGRTETKTFQDQNGNGLDWLARNLGYEGIENLAKENGFDSPDEMAKASGFEHIYSYFQAAGYASRMDALRRQKRNYNS